ncbi:reverse transcriptase family protein, partial [Alphaproteobacteria bacterium]|nr:reverse transcriptase family protein [Alphaproteobacteria bacterium]
MSGQWRKNEKDFQSSPLDPNARKLHNLAKTAIKVDRDCRAILPRINWAKPTAADRARELIGKKFADFLCSISDASEELESSPERVYRNIVSWSPGETIKTLIAIANWDSSQQQPVLDGLSKEVLNNLYDGSSAPYRLMDTSGPISMAELEVLTPNHPSILLNAYFYTLDGSNRTKQKSLVKDVFSVADGLNWKASKNTALWAIYSLFRDKGVTAQFSKTSFFGLSKTFQEEIREHYRLFTTIFPETVIKAINDEITRRKKTAEERYKKSAAYLSSVVTMGDFDAPTVLSLIGEAKASDFHDKALFKGIKNCLKAKQPTPENYALILDLPNKRSFLSLKLLVCGIDDVLSSLDTNEGFKAFQQLSVKVQTKMIGGFNLQKKTMPKQFSVGALEIVKFLIQEQLSARDEKVNALGVLNTRVAIQQYYLDVEKSIHFILAKSDGVTGLLNSPRNIKDLFFKLSVDLQMIVTRKVKTYRSKNISYWDSTYAELIAKHFPELIIQIAKGRFSVREIYALIRNGHIFNLAEHLKIKSIIDSRGWRQNLSQWNSCSQKIHPSVMKLAQVDTLIASELVRFAAYGLDQKHLKKLPIEVLVANLANRPDHCAKVDDVVSEPKRVSLIPWAQEKWRKQPAYAAAIEIALAFGFKHATFLCLLSKQLRSPNIESERGKRFDKIYRSYEIPKKSGGKRVITEPNGPLKSLQRSILELGLTRVTIHPSATGFVRGKSIVDNALPHTGKPLVVNADIRGFFPQTEFKLIRRATDQIGPDALSENARWFLAELLAYDGGLPAGAPTSPSVANVILRPMDEVLFKACVKIGVNYTRYADDITLSGEKALTVLPFVKQIASQLGYELDKKKTNV